VQPVFVIWLSDDVEANRIRVVHQVPDPKVGPARVLGDGRIPVKVLILITNRLARAAAFTASIW